MSLFKSTGQPGRDGGSGWAEVALFVALLAAAAFFRFAQLNDVPPGMTHDEAAFGAEAEWILSGQRPVYFALGYGHEPLYAYLVAGAFSVLGHTLLALRITSAVCGMLVVGFTYLLARRMYGARAPAWTWAAWIAAAWMAAAFWPVSLSRQALRAITLPMLWLPAAWLFWEGLQVAGFKLNVSGRASNSKHSTWNLRLLTVFALSGLFLGATFYTYMASRLTWLVFPLFAIYMLLRQETRRTLGRMWPGLVLMLVVAGLVVMPLALYLRANPASEIRVGLMMEPIRELLAGKPGRALGHAWNAVRVFSWVGDRFWAYNLPGRPVFHWTGSGLFYLGLAVALWRWRDARHAFLVIWLLVGMAPAMVTTNEGIFLRAIVAQPAAYLLVAVGLCALGSGLQIIGQRLRGLQTRSEQHRPGLPRLGKSNRAQRGFATPERGSQTPSGAQRGFATPERGVQTRSEQHRSRSKKRSGSWQWTSLIWGGLAAALVILEGARTWRVYFDEWPSRPEARNIYNHNLVAASRYLGETSALDAPSAVGISALYPLYYHDPWILRYVTGRDDLPVRWFDGRGAIVYPGEGDAQYIFSTLTLLHPALRDEFEAQATLVERRELDAGDQNPAFEVWHWQGQEALSDRLEELATVSPMSVSPEMQFTQPEQRQQLEGPVPFGDLVALIGYRIEGREAVSGAVLAPGESVILVTYWRALRTASDEDDWKTFVHLLDVDSQVIGGVDVLNAPPTGWLPGDVIAQVHVFTVAPDAPPGEAYLEVGVYRDATGRLPVLVDGEAAGDRVLLAPVTIE